jgi:hypothetical protein
MNDRIAGVAVGLFLLGGALHLARHWGQVVLVIADRCRRARRKPGRTELIQAVAMTVLVALYALAALGMITGALTREILDGRH